jgi:hypothetical protein
MHSTESVLLCSLCALCFYLRHTFLIELFLSPYITTELPSVLLLREFGANILIPTFVIFWGVSLTLLGGSESIDNESILTSWDFDYKRFCEESCGSVDCESLFGTFHVANGPSHRLLLVGVLYSERAFSKVCLLLSCLRIF